MVIVCCYRLLLAHSANFIKLTFMVVKIFLVRLLCAPSSAEPGATAPPLPPPLVTPLKYLHFNSRQWILFHRHLFTVRCYIQVIPILWCTQEFGMGWEAWRWRRQERDAESVEGCSRPHPTKSGGASWASPRGPGQSPSCEANLIYFEHHKTSGETKTWYCREEYCTVNHEFV